MASVLRQIEVLIRLDHRSPNWPPQGSSPIIRRTMESVATIRAPRSWAFSCSIRSKCMQSLQWIEQGRGIGLSAARFQHQGQPNTSPELTTTRLAHSVCKWPARCNGRGVCPDPSPGAVPSISRALYQCAGEGGHGFGADRTFAPLVDVFRCQCQLHVGGCDGKPPASIGQCFQQLGVFLF